MARRLLTIISIFAFCLTPLTCLGVDVENDEAIFCRQVFDAAEVTSSPLDFPYIQGYSFKMAYAAEEGEEVSNERYLSFPKGTTLTIKPKKGWEKGIISVQLQRFEKDASQVYHYKWWSDKGLSDTISQRRDYAMIRHFEGKSEEKLVKSEGYVDEELREGIKILLPDNTDYIYHIVLDFHHPDKEKGYHGGVMGMDNYPAMTINFTIDDEAPVAGSYLDVKKYHYYYAPVKWAVEKHMLPEDATELHANEDAPRSEVVEYIWKAKGSPEPKGENPFTDVSQSDDFYPAAVWAYENGITTGTTSTTFDPEGTCTRAQIVTFLWRLNSKQETTVPTTKFSDVNESDYFAQAVSWAVEKEITTGMTPTTFSPDTHCTRAQILTFLWRGREDKDEIMI